jgi:hypothetical protein
MATLDFEEQAAKLEERLPRFAGSMMRWAVEASPWARWPVALLLIVGGLVGFLPIVGFWMLPLGLIVIARDVPVLRPPLARLFAWVLRKWPERKG